MILESWKIVVFTLFGTISLFSSTCLCDKAPNYSFVKEARFAPQVSYYEYDYIIIGGGTSGCGLAATLSEGAHVLLLERGGVPYGNNLVEEMSKFGEDLDDESPTGPAQPFVSEDGVISARARVLGGGSALNAGFYTRASPDYVAQVGWAGSLVNESYTWVEKKVAFKPPMLQFQSAFKDGLLEVGIRPYNGFTYDHIEGTKIGGTIFDHNGKRHTAADLLEYANPNTTVVYLFATVHKILFVKGHNSRKPRAHGVIFRDSKGIKHKAYVKTGEMNEIILSAGSMGSPQLLMLSGIGPKAHLKKLGLKLMVDQPMVGQGMTDNPMNAVMIPSPIPVEVSLIQAVGITNFGSYIEAASSTNFANSIIHSIPTSYKSSKSSIKQDKDEKTKSYEMINEEGNDTLYAGLILEKIIGPISSGQLLLKTKNPKDNPSVTFNYFKEKEDLSRCVKGIKTIVKVIKSKAFSKFLYPDIAVEDLLTTMINLPLNRCPRQANDTGVFTTYEQFCKDTVMTIWHYHGGCQVGRVVDKDYKVYNVSRLRVIDGSTFYASPGTNPQATVMMLGRYMGRRILEERNEALSKKY